ncbi:MAG: (E)-4-hydroxy-3-methylbut-2-enyl-diphosphate synthase [Planctomycetes bacterium]|nr:(E)-4-hydroxy-3-methylbut-2-enyl-diphosphate synthase [Planctomycetota bacterium]
MRTFYARDLFTGLRRATREVKVGDVGIGGANPLRIQSMTNTDTRDVRATVDQIESLAEVDCEIVRLTVPSVRDAEVLPEIRRELAKRRITVPLVADIHFTPNAAMLCVDHVEKIRINPGNYVDRKKFEVREFSDSEYAVEIEKVADRFRPLVLRCREVGVSMRIGTNHGSLSDRVMNRFGDTPRGMVESALEFLDVCESENFYDIVFSMKASNTQIAVQAYRLLAQRLNARPSPPGGTYPFHIGVTEAGDSEDGRIKSAIGIGALLEDGIGDTIRVSLTEHPIREIPVARALAERAQARWTADEGTAGTQLQQVFTADPYSYERRETTALELAGLALGGKEPVRVELDLGPVPQRNLDAWSEAHAKSLAGQRDVACESIQLALSNLADLADLQAIDSLRRTLSKCGLDQPLAFAAPASDATDVDSLSLDLSERVSRLVIRIDGETSLRACEVSARFSQRAGIALEWCLAGDLAGLSALVDRALDASRSAGQTRLLFSCSVPRANHGARRIVQRLGERGASNVPIVLRHYAAGDSYDRSDSERAIVDVAIDLGAPLCDGIGDMVTLGGNDDSGRAVDLAYRVLQGARLRATRTEFISCPSCGRTLFDLELVTARIKSLTEHLKGVKIAIMGCIVNGPGEMADADFGYVGSGAGLVTLYVGHEVFARSVREDQAPGRLVELIKDSGRWVDPS